ncbi:minor capsid protein [Pseudomonas fluorescens]|uniref:Phage head morphogenesis protein n=1 Tax=Pseudomonas fluorescens TaxID=294 RepID=A0A0F4VEN5_PSEFL|nr:minor capsid protein [Pseudomonas fluorescens]KJZ67251.1 phage head morphogenesis protein [Pseudomonas fluorescens]
MAKSAADKIIGHQIQLRGQYTRIAKQAVQRLQKLRSEVKAELIDAMGRNDLANTFGRMGMLKRIDRAVSDQYSAMESDLVDELTALYQYELDWSDRAFKIGMSESLVSEDFIRSFVESDPFDGKLLKEWVSEQELATQTAIKRTVRLGIVNGLSSDKIVASLINDPSNPFKTSKRNAEILVRTAGAHVTASADMKGFEEAGVEKYQLSSVLDMRTTRICASLDGKVFRVADGARKMPPFHPGCRTTMIAIFDDEEPVDENFEGWLGKQSEADQVKWLGPVRYKMWKSGVRIESFVDQDDLHVLSLAELRKVDLV